MSDYFYDNHGHAWETHAYQNTLNGYYQGGPVPHLRSTTGTPHTYQVLTTREPTAGWVTIRNHTVEAVGVDRDPRLPAVEESGLDSAESAEQGVARAIMERLLRDEL